MEGNPYVYGYECANADDATDMLFSVTAIGTSAGRIAANGVLDRETADTYSISIKVRVANYCHTFLSNKEELDVFLL